MRGKKLDIDSMSDGSNTLLDLPSNWVNPGGGNSL